MAIAQHTGSSSRMMSASTKPNVISVHCVESSKSSLQPPPKKKSTVLPKNPSPSSSAADAPPPSPVPPELPSELPPVLAPSTLGAASSDAFVALAGAAPSATSRACAVKSLKVRVITSPMASAIASVAYSMWNGTSTCDVTRARGPRSLRDAVPVMAPEMRTLSSAAPVSPAMEVRNL